MENKVKNTIVLFVKTPESGTAKSRIAKECGKGKARAVYLELLFFTAQILKGFHINIAYTGNSNPGLLNKIFPNAVSFFQQRGENLGQRLSNAFNHLFNKGYDYICGIGADCPYLSPDDINDAFEYLEKKRDTVIGPTYDGGYYLIGCNKKGMPVFSASKWSTSELFKETLEIIKQNSLSCSLIRTLNDIDYMEDYFEWKQFLDENK